MDTKRCPNKMCIYEYPRRKKPDKCPLCKAFIGKRNFLQLFKPLKIRVKLKVFSLERL